LGLVNHFLFLSGVLQGILVNGLINVVISSLERRSVKNYYLFFYYLPEGGGGGGAFSDFFTFSLISTLNGFTKTVLWTGLPGPGKPSRPALLKTTPAWGPFSAGKIFQSINQSKSVTVT
jgi:hypothetical protein